MVLSDYFATWNRLRIILVIAIIACLASIIFSGIQNQSNEGDLNISNFGNYFNSWDTAFCGSSPYNYFSPFAFTFTLSSTGSAYNTPSKCAWPTANFAFRVSIGCATLIILCPLFIKTVVSRFATTIFFSSSVLWYSAFVLDANSYTLGQSACKANFASTGMATEFTKYPSTNVSINCTAGQNYIITVLIDFFIATTLFLLWLAWARCTNLYNESFSSTDASPSAPPLMTPILKTEAAAEV